MNVANILDICEENEIALKVVGDNLKVVSKNGKLGDEIKVLLKENKSHLIEVLKSSEQLPEDNIPCVYDSSLEQDFQLSSAQRRMWFSYKMDPSSAGHNLSASYSIKGELCASSMEAAFRKVVERHSSLRSTFVELDDGRAVQRIRRNVNFALSQYDISTVSAEQRDTKVTDFAITDSNTPFDLTNDLLIRVSLLCLGEAQHVLVVTQHHIVSDGWSIDVMMSEISQLYTSLKAGEAGELPPLAIQYVDYSTWMSDHLKGEVLESKMQFWRNMLTGAPEVNSLPLDLPRPKKQGYRGKLVEQKIDRGLVEKVNALALDKGVSNFMLYYAAYSLLVSRLSGESDVVIGSPISNRSHALTENMVGLFSNTIALRTNVDDAGTVSELLNQCKYRILSAQENQEVPFELIVEDINPARNLSHHPIFQLMINYQSLKRQDTPTSGPEFTALELEETLCNFDIILKILEYPNELVIHWEYSSELFNEKSIVNISECFAQLLDEFVTKHDRPLDEVSLLAPSVEKSLLDDIVLADQKSIEPACFHQLFETRVRLNPMNVAVVANNTSLSYQDLDRRANQLAHYLRNNKVKEGEVIAVVAERSAEMIIALLGIQKAGCAYLPVSGDNPVARLEHIFNDAGVRVVIGELANSLVAKLDVSIAMTELALDASDGVLNAQQTEDFDNKEVGVDGDSTAYVIYTSGSTGLPKGVELSHRGLVNLALTTSKKFGLDQNSRMLQFSSFTFDAATWDFAMAMSVGAALHMVPEATITNPIALQSYVAEHGINYSFFTPSLLNTLDANHFQCLDTIAVGGEPISLALAHKWAKGRKLFNAYGPTENTVVATCQQLFEDTNCITIGSPIENVCCFILDRNGELVPDGVIGELCISGIGVAKGYLNNVDLTAKHFISNEFATLINSRFYKTGDMVRRLSNGQIEFRGRVDDQVKIRGYRIELGEVENQIMSMAGVKECVAVAGETKDKHAKINAYVCPKAFSVETREKFVADLREHAKATLPEYMVPAAFVVLETLPLTTSGKVDKKALPEADISAVVTEGYIAPRNSIEEKLCKCWENVLGVSPVGVKDNFFALGGDSILCLQLVSRAKEAGVMFAVEDIFEYQTVEELSNIQAKHQEPAEQNSLTGEMKLLPVQCYFFEDNVEKHFFNQSVILGVPAEFDEPCLHAIVENLYRRHDALRLRYPEKEGDRVGMFCDQNTKMLDDTIITYPMDAGSPSEQISFIQKVCLDQQNAMSIEAGPLMRALYFVAADSGDSRLVIIIHHLVVDAVSWRVIMEDLSSGYSQWQETGSIAVKEKTNSFRQWREALEHYAETADLASSKNFWSVQGQAQVDNITLDHQSTDVSYSTSKSLLRKLDKTQTRELLQLAGRNKSSQMNNLLLAGLSIACEKWQSLSSVSITMESHGRDTSIKRMDLSQTVGWFTATYPLTLTMDSKVEGGLAVKEQLKQVNELLEKAADRILDYGVLKYLVKDAEFLRSDAALKPEIVFNYLGQGDQVKKEQSFEVVNDDAGPSTSLNRIREHLLGFKVVVANGELCVVVDYSENQFEDTSIARLADEFITALTDIISQSPALEVASTEKELSLVALADSMVKPASYFQQMMLEGLSLGAVDSTLSIPFHWRIQGSVDRVALSKALTELYSRHRSLGYGFSCDDGRYYISDSGNTALKIRDVDLSGASDQDRNAELDTLVAELSSEGFDLKSGPLMKVMLVKLGAEDYALLSMFHHVVFDGWSLMLVKQELQSLYRAFASGKKHSLPDVNIQLSDFSHWQRAKSQSPVYQAKLASVRDSLNVSHRHEKITTVRPRSEHISRELGTETLYFDQNSVESLAAFTAQEGVTNYTVFVLAFRLSLYLYSKQENLLLSSPQADRDEAGIQNTVGAFLNWMVVNVPVKSTQSIFDYFLSAKSIVSDAYRNRDVSIFAVTEGMEERMQFHDIISSVQFQYLDGLNNADDRLRLDGLEVASIVRKDATVENHNDLSAVVLKSDKRIRCELSFNRDLFDAETAKDILSTMNKIVNLFVNSDDRKIHKI